MKMPSLNKNRKEIGLFTGPVSVNVLNFWFQKVTALQPFTVPYRFWTFHERFRPFATYLGRNAQVESETLYVQERLWNGQESWTLRNVGRLETFMLYGWKLSCCTVRSICEIMFMFQNRKKHQWKSNQKCGTIQS